MTDKVEIPRVQRGDPIRAADWNKIAEAFRFSTPFTLPGRRWFHLYNGLEVDVPIYGAFSYNAGEVVNELPLLTLAYGGVPFVLTNAGNAISAGQTGFAHIVDQWTPCLFLTEDEIDAGATCGPGADDFYVHSDQTGLVSITSTSAGGGEIWCVGTNGLGFKKLLCRFTLDETLDTSTESVSATLESQYGPGVDHTLDSTITVYNLLTSSSNYVFEGESGAAGYAFWDSETNWRIIQMECPTS